MFSPVWSMLIVSFALTAYGLPTDRIVGGEDAPPGKYPYQVSLRRFGSHFCGGSIVNKRYILTAAHCVYTSSPTYITVVVGSHVLNSGGNSYGVSKIIAHAFDPRTAVNDIALLRVSKDIEFSEYVQPVELSVEEDVFAKYPAIATGWGRTGNGLIPNNLQEITLSVIPEPVCQEKWLNMIITAGHVCTFNRVGQGMCNGDSGGPLVANGKQVGIVSFGSGSGCAKGVPDVFTRVSHFLDWIQRKTSQE